MSEASFVVMLFLLGTGQIINIAIYCDVVRCNMLMQCHLTVTDTETEVFSSFSVHM